MKSRKYSFFPVVPNDKSILHHDNMRKQRLQDILKIPYILSDSHNERAIFDSALFEFTDNKNNV